MSAISNRSLYLYFSMGLSDLRWTQRRVAPAAQAITSRRQSRRSHPDPHNRLLIEWVKGIDHGVPIVLPVDR
jgi:hypothetical protein